MKINWFFNTNENKFYKFSNRNYFFDENAKGKTKLISQILYPLSINVDLAKNNEDLEYIICLEHDNQEIVLLRHKNIYKASINGKIINDSRSVIYKEILEYFNIPYFTKNGKLSNIFKSMFKHTTYLQSGKMEDDFAYIKIHGATDQDNFSYLANAFRDEFLNINIVNDILKYEEKTKKTKNSLTAINEKLSVLSNYTFTSLFDEKIQEAMNLNSDLKKKRTVLINKIAEESILQKKLYSMSMNKEFADSWRNKYKDMMVVIKGVKFTIEDFLSEFNVGDESKDMVQTITNQVSHMESQINILKREIADVQRKQNDILNSVDRDYILLKNKNVSDLEKEKLDLIDKLDVFKRKINTLKEAKRDNDFKFNIYNIMKTDFPNEVLKQNISGEYSNIKINLATRSGAIASLAFLRMQELADKNRGFYAPYIYDGIMDKTDKKNTAKVFSVLNSEFAADSQILLFAHDKEEVDKLNNKWMPIIASEVDPETAKIIGNISDYHLSSQML